MSSEPTRPVPHAPATSPGGVRTSSPHLGAILDVVTNAFVLCDRSWRCLYMNAAAASVAGKRPADLIGTNLWDTFPPGHDSVFAEQLRSAAERSEASRIRAQDDRSGRWYDIHFYPGEKEFVLLYHDAAVQPLARERPGLDPRACLVAEAVPAILAHVDEDEIFRYVNAHFERVFGIPRSQVLGRHVRDIVGDEAYAVIHPYMQAALSGEAVSYELDLPFAGPGVRRLRATYLPQRELIDGKHGFFSHAQDVTDAAEVQRKLYDSEDRLRFTLQSANVGTWDWDLTSGTVDWSDNLEAIHGRLPGKFANSFDSVQEDILPEDVEYVQQAIAKALNERSDYLVQYRVVKYDGSIIWVEGKGRAQYDENGRPIRMVGICTDITERKLAEEALHRSEQELRALNATLESRVEERTRALEESVRALEMRNHELQHFAFAASHDLQEPLRKIATFCDILQSEYADRLDDEGKRYIDRMEIAALRMSTLLRDLLSFSRITSRNKPFREIDLNGALANVLSDLEEKIKASGARIEASDLHQIEGDSVQIRLLLQNLIDNAIKFHRPDVPPVVRIETAVLPAQESGPEPSQVVLTVGDNGIGFDVQHARRIFSPFQRLHNREAYEGSGIGLALCTRIAERHRASIKADSTPGQGSTFTVTFPLRG